MNLEGQIPIFINSKNKLIKNKNPKYLLKLFIILNISYILMDIMLKIEEFNEIINDEYRQQQNNFCKNINEYYNQEFENKIKFAKVSFNNITYIMSVYKKNDIVSNEISRIKTWDKVGTYNLLNGLNFYSQKKNLINKDIYIIDIGGNIGWFTFLLGKFGYNIITFEPSRINYYILKKNYCLNKEVNATLINKGLFAENKMCNIYSKNYNIGNGRINCTEKSDIKFNNNGEIILTKLSNYISFFKNKNLAMIKVDTEGTEGKAIESGIELITKYHVPFIYLEFTPKDLSSYGTNPQKFLEMFIKNGYKINLLNFFEKKIYDMKYLLRKNNINFYIVYTPFLK